MIELVDKLNLFHEVTLVALSAGLLGLNLWQLWFWSRYVGRLVDKLMSRNYAEYKQIEQSGSSKDTRTQHVDSSQDDPVLNDLNRMLGGM